MCLEASRRLALLSSTAAAEHSSRSPRASGPAGSRASSCERWAEHARTRRPGPAELPADVSATVATVGTFDGVHCGHQDVLARLVARATSVGLPSVLVTFEPHPLEVVNPQAAPMLLTTREEKLALLAATGFDYLAVAAVHRAAGPVSGGTSSSTRFCANGSACVELLIGHDHGFGRGREGDINLLRTLGAARGFRVDVVPPVVTAGGQPVSSSVVRRALAAGDLDAARALLGRHYSVTGRGSRRRCTWPAARISDSQSGSGHSAKAAARRWRLRRGGRWIARPIRRYDESWRASDVRRRAPHAGGAPVRRQRRFLR